MWSIFRMFKPLPKVGEIYVLNDSVDPWSDKRPRVEVLDVSPGWVRYKFVGSKIFTDERMRKSTFHAIYVLETPCQT